MKFLIKKNIATRTERFNHNSIRMALLFSLAIIDANRISVRIEATLGRLARTLWGYIERAVWAQTPQTCHKTALWVDKVA